MKTLEELVTTFLSTRTEAPIAECCELVLKAQAQGELAEADTIWIERAQRRGLEVAVEARFRALRFKLKGVTLRRLGVVLDEQGQHAWVDLQRVLTEGTAAERAAVSDHAWSVVAEAVGMIREQYKIIVACGSPAATTKLRIEEMLRGAFAEDKKKAKPAPPRKPETGGK
jgi:hypothetical protein